jgi:hypothetical protein
MSLGYPLTFISGAIVFPVSLATLIKVVVNAIQCKQLYDYKFMMVLVIMGFYSAGSIYLGTSLGVLGSTGYFKVYTKKELNGIYFLTLS